MVGHGLGILDAEASIPTAAHKLQHTAPSHEQLARSNYTPTMDAPPALPPQMFTTSAQLLDLTDSKCASL